MATGMIQQQAPHDSPPPQTAQSSDSHPPNEETTTTATRPQTEGQQPAAVPPILNPEEITENPEEKKLGFSAYNLTIKDFVLLKTLGTGTFARVWLARLSGLRDDQNQIYALKILSKADVIKLKQVEHIRNERNILAAVAGHPFITTLVTSFSDEQCLYMQLDYCAGGEIFSFLRRARRFNESTSKFYAAEITLVMEFLHNIEGVAYRDLKPENILLDGDGHIRLVDFGFAKKIGNRETYTLCGTPEYLAPEVIHNSGHGLAVDWWALGILVYEFLVGQPPFWDSNPLRIYEQIVEGRIRFPQNMTPDAKDLIAGLCKTNPSERLGHISGGAGRVKDHPFFHDINWDDLYHRRMKGPIIPRIDHPADSGNFEDYPPPDTEKQSLYTEDMREKYEDQFADF